MTEAQNKGQIRIYACGGAGINVGKLFEVARGENAPAFAQMHVSYLDTSDSNLKAVKTTLDNVYRIEGIDGSGQVRAENYEEIAPRVRDMLQKHPALDLSIVIHSFSGGSGSVIGPSLVAELTDEGKNVIVIGIGDASTVNYANNTMKTIKSYGNIAHQKDTPIIAAYFENTATTPRGDVDLAIQQLVTALAVLFSRENHELDSADLRNWLNFQKVTSFEAQLGALTLFEGSDLTADYGEIITVATLATEKSGTTLNSVIGYQTVGWLPAGDTEQMKKVHAQAPIHFMISDGVFGDVNDRLEKFLADHQKRVDSRPPKKNTILKGTEGAQKNGVVL